MASFSNQSINAFSEPGLALVASAFVVGTALIRGNNVASVSFNGVGVGTFTFNAALPNTNYIVKATVCAEDPISNPVPSGNEYEVVIISRTTAAVQIQLRKNGSGSSGVWGFNLQVLN
jgi:hypothetical protein